MSGFCKYFTRGSVFVGAVSTIEKDGFVFLGVHFFLHFLNHSPKAVSADWSQMNPNPVSTAINSV